MLLTVLLLLSLAVFLAGSLARAYLLLRLPLHGRWELYPVPREKGRAAYGGSYYEETLWWQRPRATSFSSELLAMLGEMLFITRLRDHQKALWWASLSFHWGLYCLAAFTGLLAASAGLEIGGVAGGGWPGLLAEGAAVCGWAGMVLGLAGTLGLLGRRLLVPALRLYSGPREYVPLVLFAGAYLTGVAAWAAGRLALPLAVMKALLSLSPVPAAVTANAVATAHLCLLSLLLISIPLSRLSHYLAKFVTFHLIQWDNEPNLPGSRLERRVAGAGKVGAGP